MKFSFVKLTIVNYNSKKLHFKTYKFYLIIHSQTKYENRIQYINKKEKYLYNNLKEPKSQNEIIEILKKQSKIESNFGEKSSETNKAEISQEVWGDKKKKNLKKVIFKIKHSQ